MEKLCILPPPHTGAATRYLKDRITNNVNNYRASWRRYLGDVAAKLTALSSDVWAGGYCQDAEGFWVVAYEESGDGVHFNGDDNGDKERVALVLEELIVPMLEEWFLVDVTASQLSTLARKFVAAFLKVADGGRIDVPMWWEASHATWVKAQERIAKRARTPRWEPAESAEGEPVDVAAKMAAIKQRCVVAARVASASPRPRKKRRQ